MHLPDAEVVVQHLCRKKIYARDFSSQLYGNIVNKIDFGLSKKVKLECESFSQGI